MAKKLILLLMIVCLIAGCQAALSIQPADDTQNFTGTLRVGLRSHVTPSGPYPVQRGNEGILRSRSEAFMEKYPGVQIQIEVVHYDRDFPILLEDPKQMPDIIQLTVNEARYAMLPNIESLADRIEDNAAAWQGDYWKLIEFAEIDGEPYLLPFTSDPLIVYYRKDVFEKEQLAEPRDGWTYGELAEIIHHLADEGYKFFPPDNLNDMEPFIRGLGGTYASEDGSVVSGYLDSEETVAAFVQFAAMIPGAGEHFVGKVGRPSLSFSDLYHFPYAIAPIPSNIEGKRYNNTLLTGLAISKTTVQPELAWEYMKYLMGESSDEAIDFVVTNTLDREYVSMRFGHLPVYEEIRSWMKREVAASPPATFDLLWNEDNYPGLYIRSVPQRSLDQIRTYADPEGARLDLAKWAKEMETSAPLLSSWSGSGSGSPRSD